MSVALMTFGKKGARKDFGLVSGPLVIGRRIDADLRIPLAEVSRSHCQITVNGNTVMIRDLGSSNGTFVNNERVVEATLKAGDRIMIGPVVFTVQIDGVPGDIARVVPPAKAEAAPDAATVVKSAGDSDEFDIDEIGELDIDDLSDLDLDGVSADDTAGLEEIDDLEEIDEADLVPDDDDEKAAP